MKKFQSHFELTKQQRNGILFLVLVIIGLQIFLYFFNSQKSKSYIEDEDLIVLEKKIDSLKNSEKQASNSIVLQPFNPNFLTDYRGYVLGMSTLEIDKISTYRKTGKWINSIEEFQKISGVSDSLIETISPFFKFPDWVNNPAKQKTEIWKNERPSFKNKLDLNSATAQDLKLVNGVGEVLADRIVKYRNSLKGGFASIIELENVYGLKPEVINNLSEMFQIKNPRKIETIDLNKADRDQLVTIPFIDYELAHRIVEYRKLHEGFRSLDELKSVKEFPENKFEQIKLYLQLN